MILTVKNYMKKFFITLSILLITTSAFSKNTKDTKKINPNICEDAIKNGKILGNSGSSGDYNIRFILEKNDKLYRYTVNKQFTECYNIDEKHN
tara:strand:- start:233 stop:511 length:279 start_codon:yes stop_codon:yes gene_type:complete